MSQPETCGCDSCDCGAAASRQPQRRPAPRLTHAEVFGTGDGPTVGDLIRAGERQLRRADVPSPRADAAQICEHVLGIDRGRLSVAGRISEGAADQVRGAFHRRAEREPLQHITGVAYFRHLALRVGPGVFVPRPETELVTQAVLDSLPVGGPATVVDLCAGSGAIAVSVATERPDTTVYAVEIDRGAIAWLSRNVADHAASLAGNRSRIVVVHGDAGAVARPDQPLAHLRGSVSVVVSNPPYVPDDAVPRDPEVRRYDPALALYGGADGLDTVRRIADTAADLLPTGAVFVCEHAAEQGQAAGQFGMPGLLARHEDVGRSAPVWSTIEDHVDLAGLPRYTIAVRGH